MKNLNNCADIDKIYSQLKRAEIQKKQFFRNIYREYELYLNLVRNLLYISVEKGLKELFVCQSIKDNLLNGNEFYCLFEKKISKYIFDSLPLLTVEQLKINKIKKNINKEINLSGLGIPKKTKDDQKEKFQYADAFQLEESIQFKISEDISYNSEYYQAEKDEKFVSLDFDNKDFNNYLSNKNIVENIKLDKQFISSLHELIEEVEIEMPRHSEIEYINQTDISSNYQSLKIFDLVDQSLENLLLNLSYNINQELFKAKLLKKMISQDSFEYLVGKKLMIKHIHPFVINFDLNINNSPLNGDYLPSIIFLNLSTVELEFYNLSLSIQRNKINELRIQFQRLIKKETYWKQKELSLNKIR